MFRFPGLGEGTCVQLGVAEAYPELSVIDMTVGRGVERVV